MIALCSITLALSALLLFWIEPLAGKFLTPLLGGSPQVWVTCLLFFQVLMLASYAYADLLTRRLGWRLQFAVHTVVLVAGFTLLPLQIPSIVQTRAGIEAPVPWVLGALFVMLGSPFFALGAHGPLLQRWFASSEHPRARDPFFLYAASNLGSLVGLLAFPLLLEPMLPSSQQARIWTVGYAVTAVLVLVVAWRTRRRSTPDPLERAPRMALRPRRVLSWLGLASLATAQLLAQSVQLQQDLAAVPLIWVLPLAVYLLSFVIAFSRFQDVALRVATRLWPPVVVAQVYLLVVHATEPAWLVFSMTLLTLAIGNVLCHTRLAELRPDAGNLTRYYLVMSAGGALGGLLVAGVAPLVFSSLIEVPLVLVLVTLALPRSDAALRWPLVMAGVAIVVAVVVALAQTLLPEMSPVLGRVLAGLPLIIAYASSTRREAWALALGGCLLALLLARTGGEREVARARSFFGVHRVVEVAGERRLYHGTTRHNSQRLDPAWRDVPGTYYHPLGPAGQALRVLAATPTVQHVALLGMGAGALAVYARPGQHWVFFEIDDEVVKLAREQFSFLRDSPAASIEVVLGDGRLQLARQAPASYQILVLDAFSSGAVPLHLLTVEAFETYLRGLSEHGVLLVHVSNRYLDITAEVARLARASGLHGRWCLDPGADEGFEQRSPSEWVVLARHPQDLEPLSLLPQWVALPASDKVPLFSDDFSNFLGVMLP